MTVNVTVALAYSGEFHLCYHFRFGYRRLFQVQEFNMH